MQINLTPKEFRRLLDLVYIGNWVLNSTRGEDRFADYDNLESKLFALSPALSEHWNGTVVPSRAYQEGGIHEAIACYEDNVFYEILAEIYAARERNTIGISSAQLAEQIPGAVYCETLPDVTAYLRENVREGDIVVTMGAGDIFRAGEALISGE